LTLPLFFLTLFEVADPDIGSRPRRLNCGLILALIFGGPWALAADNAARIEIDLDPRLEMLFVFRVLNDSPATSAAKERDPELVRGIQERFKHLRTHPAVVADGELDIVRFTTPMRFEALWRHAFSIWEAGTSSTTSRLAYMAGGSDKWRAWTTAAAVFAQEPTFLKHLEERRKQNAPYLDALRRMAAKNDEIGRIERYTGLAYRGKHVIKASPFELSDDAFGLVVRKDDGSVELINGISPARLDLSEIAFATSLWHEDAHGLLDTLTDLHVDRINESAGLLREAAAESPVFCGGSWVNCVRENINDAVALRLVALNYEPDLMAELSGWISQKGKFLGPLTAKLKEYEGARGKHKSLVSFYPSLLSVFPKSPVQQRPALAPAGRGANLTGMLSVAPFNTHGSRKNAAELLDLLLPGSRDPARYVQSAALRIHLGEPERAAKDASIALDLSPDDVGALLLRAESLIAMGLADRAARDLESAKKLCEAEKSPPACRMRWPTAL